MPIVLNASSFNSADFIIPTSTLGMVSRGLSDVSRWKADKMHVQIVTTLLSTILLGIYTFCAAYTAKILIGRGLKGTQRKLFYVTMAMYLATFTSWVALVVSQFQAFHTFRRNLSDVYSWIPPSECFPPYGWDYSGLPGYCTLIPAASTPSEEWPSVSECVGTVALTINVSLGDAIVWWRAWVLWNKRSSVLLCFCMIVLATLGFGVVDSWSSCTIQASPRDFSQNIGGVVITSNSGAYFIGSFLGVGPIASSLFSNAVVTLLAGYKAWKHRQNAITHFAQVPSVVQAQRALMLLVESGIAYCLIWGVVFASQLVESDPLQFGMQYFAEGRLLALVGIYPTLIIILVALDKSEIDKQSRAWSLPTIRSVVQPSHHQVEVATDAICGSRP